MGGGGPQAGRGTGRLCGLLPRLLVHLRPLTFFLVEPVGMRGSADDSLLRPKSAVLTCTSSSEAGVLAPAPCAPSPLVAMLQGRDQLPCARACLSCGCGPVKVSEKAEGLNDTVNRLDPTGAPRTCPEQQNTLSSQVDVGHSPGETIGQAVM